MLFKSDFNVPCLNIIHIPPLDSPVAEPVVVVEVLGAREAVLDCGEDGDATPPPPPRSGKSPTPYMHAMLSQCSGVRSHKFIAI